MRGVRKAFGATLALDGVDFEVRAGEVHALVGENGAGKSTLMKILAGAVAPDAGRLLLEGEPFEPRHPLGARQAGIAMIYQELSLAPHLNAVENILLGTEITRRGFLRHGQSRIRALQALEQLGHPDLPLDIPVGRLSVAEQQIVEIARALGSGCRVLVLDEPTSSLTATDTEQLFTVIAGLRASGLGIVYISHFLEEVKRIADRITVLRDGRVVGGGISAGLEIEAIVTLMVGQPLGELFPPSARIAGEPVLRVTGLTGVSKFHEVSFTLHRGEVLGIAGLVGAGRTELIRAIFGLDPIRRGEVTVGSWTGAGTPVQRWKQGAGLLSEDRSHEGLATPLSIADNITMNLGTDVGIGGFVSPRLLAAAADRWIRQLGIKAAGPHQTVAALSGGNQQKVALARLLHQRVDILLLDEPTRGIDVASKQHIYELIDRLASGSDGSAPRAILVVSSYFPELLGMCDRIAVMHRGRLGPARPAREWTQHLLMTEAVGGTA
jgi:ribose transport system ATP-binding protein